MLSACARRFSASSRQLLLLLTSVALSAALAAHANAATYYVATNGSDGNPGTEAAPFQTLARGSKALAAGDTLYIKAGTYNESLNAGVNGFVFRSGTSSAYTRYAASPGDERKVILKPPASDQALYNFGGKSESDTPVAGDPIYIEVSGLVFDGSNSVITYEGTTVYRLNGLMHGCLPVRLINNEFRFARQGINGGGCAQIIGNEFHHITGYGIYGAPSNALVERNIFHDIGGYGIQVFTQNHRVNNWIVRNNIFFNNGFGYWFEDKTNGWRRNTAVALLVSRGSHQVYNNLVYNNYAGIQAFSDTNDDLIANNTVYGNKTFGIVVDEKASKISVINNIVWGNGTNISAGDNTTTQNNLTEDPHVVNASGGDFHLTSGSTNAIDKGITQTAVPHDFDYGKRPFGTAYDIGAFEFGSPPGIPPIPPIPAGAGGGSSGPVLRGPNGEVCPTGYTPTSSR